MITLVPSMELNPGLKLNGLLIQTNTSTIIAFKIHDNGIYPSSEHHPPLIPLRLKTASPLPHGGDVNIEDDQKLSMKRS